LINLFIYISTGKLDLRFTFYLLRLIRFRLDAGTLITIVRVLELSIKVRFLKDLPARNGKVH
jgi:hypothetical protein